MDVHFWRDISLMLLMAEVFVIGLPFLALFFFAVRLMRQARQEVEGVFPQVRERVEKAEAAAKTGSRTVIAPTIRILSLKAGLVRGLRSLISSDDPSPPSF